MNNNKQFVLSLNSYGAVDGHWDGYYTGDTYVHQGEVYVVCDTDIIRTKKYSSRKRAENVAKSLFKKITNYIFEVEEV